MITDVQKEIIITTRQQGVSYSGIAEQLLLSPNTVKSVCRRSGVKVERSAERSTDVCKTCGEPLQQIPGSRKKTFCSDKCRYLWWNRKRCRYPYRLTCFHCGKQFISDGNRNRKYCGRDCYILSRYGEGLP